MEPEKEELKGNLTRQIAGTGYEIGAGLTFDALTAPLAWTGPVYAAANFGEGAFSNIVGQLIRGEKFNWSEVVSSGALGMVPLSQLKAAKYLKRPAAEAVENVVGKAGSGKRFITSGAVTGVADQTIQAGLGEQRLPTTEEVVGGALIGSAIGGGIKGTAVLGRNLRDQIAGKWPGNFVQSLGAGGWRGGTSLRPIRKDVDQFLLNQRLYKNLSEVEQSRVRTLMNAKDDYYQSRIGTAGFDYQRPSIGYTASSIYPENAITTEGGRTLSIKWVNNLRKGKWQGKSGWRLYDREKGIRSTRRRYRSNIPNQTNAAIARRREVLRAVPNHNKIAQQVLDRLTDSSDPNDIDLYNRIIGGQGAWYHEHVNHLNSAAWVRDAQGNILNHRWKRTPEGDLIKFGDADNMRLIGDTVFARMKSNIEEYLDGTSSEVIALRNRYYLDMDSSGDLLIRDTTRREITGEDVLIKTNSGEIARISRRLNPEDAVDAFKNAIKGGENFEPPDIIQVDRTYTIFQRDLMQETGDLGLKDDRLPVEKVEEELQEDIKKQRKKIDQLKNVDNPIQWRIDQAENELKDLQDQLKLFKGTN